MTEIEQEEYERMVKRYHKNIGKLASISQILNTINVMKCEDVYSRVKILVYAYKKQLEEIKLLNEKVKVLTEYN